MEQHVCQVSGTEASIKVARYKMKKQVQENPSKPIPQIYEEIRKEVLQDFDNYGQIAMMQDFPSFHSVQSQLYKERHCFVPRSQFCRRIQVHG